MTKIKYSDRMYCIKIHNVTKIQNRTFIFIFCMANNYVIKPGFFWVNIYNYVTVIQNHEFDSAEQRVYRIFILTNYLPTMLLGLKLRDDEHHVKRRKLYTSIHSGCFKTNAKT